MNLHQDLYHNSMNGREGVRVIGVTRILNVPDKEGPMTLFAGSIWYGTKSINRIRFRLDVEVRRVEGKAQVARTKKTGQIGLMQRHTVIRIAWSLNGSGSVGSFDKWADPVAPVSWYAMGKLTIKR